MDPVARNDPERSALARVLSSPTFERSLQLKRFLEFVIEKTFQGKAEEIKEYSIAVEACGRPSSFDPTIDPTVRTEARRLRQKLESYYANEGRDDPLRIVIPKGSYVPAFVAGGSESRTAGSRRTARLFGGAALAALLGLGLLLLPRNAPRANPRVAVLPFELVDGRDEDDGLPLAMSASILTKLTQLRGVDVASRSSIYSYRGSALSPGEIADVLDADYVVSGDLTRARDSLQLSARLFRARDRKEVWRKSFDFAWSDVFRVEDELSEDLAEQLRASTAREAAGRPPSVEAYEAYVKGRFSGVEFLNTRVPAFFPEAERRLLEAVELDPRLADAWAELGRIHYGRVYPPLGERAEALRTATSHLERALDIDPSNATALYTLGLVRAQSGRHREGIELCRRAIGIDPGDPGGYDSLGQIYMWLGFYESALLEFDEAISRDPLYLSAFIYRALALSSLERWEEALRTTEIVGERFPDIPGRELFQGNVFYAMGKRTWAEALWQEGNETLSDGLEPGYYDIALALVSARNGNTDEGRRVLEKFRGTPYRDQTHLTELAALLHETDFAVARIAGHPQRNYRWLVSTPALARLAGEPPFAELARSLYANWLSDIAALGASLPKPPPRLPDPDAWLLEAPASVRTE